MRSLAVWLRLVILLGALATLGTATPTSASTARPGPQPVSPYSVFTIQRSEDGAGVKAAGGDGAVKLVPAVRVDDPITTGKRRVQNACDKCSLCLGKTGDAVERDTMNNLYKRGSYAYTPHKQAAVDRCLANRFCQACEVRSVTYTLPAAGFDYREIRRILESTTFPPQSYLLNIDYNIVSSTVPHTHMNARSRDEAKYVHQIMNILSVVLTCFHRRVLVGDLPGPLRSFSPSRASTSKPIMVL
jgi:hypothetical protein